jgi:AraC-like DNA-binding protein
LAYIAHHLGSAIAVRDLAADLGYSPTYLTDLVRRETGLTIQQWVIRERLALGERLLQDTDLTVDVIACSLGYSDPGYFSRQFRQHRGMTPVAWRSRMTPPGEGPS